MYNSNSYQTPVSKATAIGLFAGIMATIACLFFDFTYRDLTGLSLSWVINVSTIIFGCNLILVLVGVLYGLLKNAFAAGKAVFIIVFVLVTLFCLWKVSGIHQSPDLIVAKEFRQLLSGMVIIIGLCSFLLIPVLYQSKKFEDAVL